MRHIPRAGLALLFLSHHFSSLPLAHAGVFITHPYRGIICSGGSECTVTWADDGLTPLLAAVGPSDFALFQGVNTLVQQLATGLDVSETRDLTFIPNSNAGPNSHSYWIKLTSLSAKDPNDTSQPYTSFSGFFTLNDMSGIEGSPVASLTSSLPSSSSQTQTQGSDSTSNGVISTTTLSGVIPTGSASTLSSAISALSAISSAASGSSSRLLTTSLGSSSTTRSGSATGTSSSPSGTSTSGSARLLGNSPSKLGAALVLVVLATQASTGLL